GGRVSADPCGRVPLDEPPGERPLPRDRLPGGRRPCEGGEHSAVVGVVGAEGAQRHGELRALRQIPSTDDADVVSAASTIALLPIIIVFIVLQKYFIEPFSGAVKG